MILDGYLAPSIVLIASALLIIGRYFYRARLHAQKGDRRSIDSLDILIVIAIIVLAASLELSMGRTPFYKNGPVQLWSGDINTDQNSQQLLDPYTLTHISHGILFYALFWLIGRGLSWWRSRRVGSKPQPGISLGLRALLTISAESAWEVFENTDMVVNRYRAQTISLGYFGDSVINSVVDILACLLGFIFASKFPAWATIAFIVLLEVVLAFWIRDGLFLNILMLIYPLQAVKNWQMGST